MKKVYLFLVLMLGLGITFNAMAQRTFYGQSEKQSQHNLNVRFGDIVYDQSADEEYGGYIVSQWFTNEADSLLRCEAADDFVVPEGETWTVGSFGVWGTWWPDSDGDPEKIDIYIYEDNDGKPADNPIDFYEGETNFYAEEWFTGDEHESYYNFTFPSPLEFTEGHYWISFRVRDSYDKVGQWGWQDVTNENWEVWHWRNPGGGWPQGGPDWQPSNAVTPFVSYLDLRFTLYGEAYDDDIATIAITSPVTGVLTATEAVTMTIKNQGNNTQTGFDVAFSVDGGAWVTENVGALELAAEGVADYTFTATADLSVTGFHTIACKTMLAGDEQPANNEASKDVTNYGIIHEMVNNDTINIESCTGTFTDMGGVDGPIMASNNGVVTFIPEAGKKIKLDFFGVWDISHPTGGVKPFQVFDGPDVNSPLLGEWTQNDWRDYGIKPDILKALGPTGEMTIRYQAPSWITNPPFPEGWTALVECYTQEDDDFEMTDFHIDPTLVFTDQDITFSATVRNIGAIAQTKTVTFYVNGEAVGTATTDGDVAPTESATVEYVHVFAESGDVEITAALPDDSGDIDDNEMSLETFVWLNGWFVEMFDDGYFPPDDWTPGFSWTGSDYGYSGACATSYVETFMEDTLWTPQLVMHEGDFVSFFARTSNWWPGNLKVVWKNGETGETQLLEYVDLAFSSQFIDFQVDVSAAAGNNYLGFVNVGDVTWSWGSEIYIDNVMGAGILYFYYDYDMKMVDFNPFPTPSKNEPVDFEVTVQNNGLMPMADGEYTVKIMQVTEEGDVELASVPGIAANPTQVKTHTLSVTFDKIGPTEVYAIVDLPGDQKPDNDASIVRPVYVQVNGTTIVTVAEGTDEDYSIPSAMGQASNISEVIYPAEMINPTDVTGFITGIAYAFNNYNTAPTLNVPIEVWIGETEEDDLTNGFINGTELTKVAEAHIDLNMGLNQQLYIPFINPYDYQGGNLCVLFFKPYASDYFQGVQWLGTSQGPTPDSTVAYATSYNPPLDPNTIGSNPNLNWKAFTPQTSFYIGTVGTANLSGYVYDENSDPFEGVKVEVVGFDNETYTAANGQYSFLDLLAWENLIRASEFGYYDNDQSIVLFQGEANTLSFDMEPLPQVMVYGTVIGNYDYSNYLEGAEVTLSGYENYSATVGADGTFAIENVYGDKTYSLLITYPGYAPYTNDNVQVTDVDKNLYTMSLTELLLSPFYTQAEQISTCAVEVNWNSPLDAVTENLNYEPLYINNGYTAELGEEVWLGNIYEDVPAGSIDNVSMYWAQYGETSGTVRLDLMDENGDIFYSSEPFETVHDGWVDVDVPNITWEGGTIFAMVYWDGTNLEFTDYLAADIWELGLGVNYAYIMYPGDDAPSLLSNLLGSDATFQVEIEVLTEGADGGRYNEGYNIYRGPWADINNWESWMPINAEPVTGNTYVDEEWPGSEELYTYGVQTVYTNGTSEVAFAEPFVDDPSFPCEQPWEYVVTGSVHTISVPATANPNVYGEPLVEGDWVGVFYMDDNGDQACGGAGQIGPLGSAVVTAYGDDPLTPEKDGFANGERFIWRMNVCATCAEYPAGATYDDTKPNMGYFADLGLSSLTSLEVMVCQYYSFTEGWNGISSYINPFDADVETMFAPIVDDIIIMRNLTQVWWPGESINTIGDFDNGAGYAIKLTADHQFEICGPDFYGTELMLETGWFYMPTLSQCSVDAMALFGDNLDDIIIVQDLIGTGVFWPAQNIYTLETLEPGHVYKIKAANAFSITFPECDAKATTPEFSQVNTINTVWGDVNMTPSTEAVAFQASATVDFIEGDVIGAFGQNNQLYGYMTVNGAGVAQAITLFGDDVTTMDQDGFTEGEAVSYMLYRGATGETYDLNVEYDNAMDNVSGNYYTGSFAAIRSITMGITGIGTVNGGSIDMYPNPATDMVHISLNNVENTDATVVVFNTEGRQVLNQVFNGQAEVNVSSLEAGIYFVKINTATMNEIRKLVIK